MKRDEDVGEKKIVCLSLDVDYKLSMISYRENKQNPKKSPCIIPLRACSDATVPFRSPIQMTVSFRFKMV